MPSSGREQAVEVLDEGALARARVADDGHELARVDLYARRRVWQPFSKGVPRAVYVRQVLGPDDRVHSFIPFLRRQISRHDGVGALAAP